MAAADEKYYNQEQKERYIEYFETRYGENEKSVFNLKNLFHKAEYFEENYKKDISEWSVSEIISFLTFLNSRSFSVLTMYRSFMVTYTQWCLQNSLSTTGQNNWQIVTHDLLVKCLNDNREDYLTRDDILRLCDRTVNPGDAFLILGLYEGINAYGKNWEEISWARLRDINQTKKTIKLVSGRTIPISDELIEYAKKAAAATEIYYGDTGKKAPVSTSEPFDLIIKTKGRKNENIKITGQRCYRRLDALLSKMNLNVSANTLKEYGRMAYVKSHAEAEGISVEEWIGNKANENRVIEIYGPFQRSQWIRIYNEYFSSNAEE